MEESTIAESEEQSNRRPFFKTLSEIVTPFDFFYECVLTLDSTLSSVLLLLSSSSLVLDLFFFLRSNVMSKKLDPRWLEFSCVLNAIEHLGATI